MQYVSTRDKNIKVSAVEAIQYGLAKNGGLFVPEVFPTIDMEFIKSLIQLPYAERAAKVMDMFIEEFSYEQILGFCKEAYSTERFDTVDVAPVKTISDNTHYLELWHGPTAAFKDMALQMLPHLLTKSIKARGEDREVCILVATSGDTGKAALEGFRDIDGTKIYVFYPVDGVSDVQKLQMTSQKGNNVGVCGVVGNFDDAQTGVKKIFSDPDMTKKLNEKGYFFSSANSINWGRLLPQIAYYISAYCDLVKINNIKMGDEITFCVPTGNFGNILAGYYAKKMGLPIKRLICASNENNVLTDFINTGVYDKNRKFYTTASPSMDILISSNLERLIFELSGCDDVRVKKYMDELFSVGKYKVDEDILNKIQEFFVAGYCSDKETKETINKVWNEDHYLIDTHTAVAAKVTNDVRTKNNCNCNVVIVSTASPYKFCDNVLEALGEKTDASGVELIARLEEATKVAPPKPLAELKNAVPRFNQKAEKTDMPKVVLEFLGIL